jgi:hypothetical protein
MRIQADLVDQLFNSAEKRLARVPLLLAHFLHEQAYKLGFLQYNGGLRIHSLLTDVLHD